MAEQIILPGLVDMHVHLRDPGYTLAEDFDSGTRAALAGGVVAVFDMPNNKNNPTFTIGALENKFFNVEKKARADVGFYFGAPPDQKLEVGSTEYNQLVELFNDAGCEAFGLKLYCDITTGNEHRHGAEAFRSVATAWLEANPNGLILAHTEGREATAGMIDLVAKQLGGRIHIPHVSKQEELEVVIKAKQYPEIADMVSTGVCPHHLFLSEEDVPILGWYARMKPSLGTVLDRSFLRDNIDVIDVIETDHAPHTRADKEFAQTYNPTGQVGTDKPTCFGVPGLETMLPLLIRGEQEGWISRKQIIDKTSTKPARILGLDIPVSEVCIDVTPHIMEPKDIYSRCRWSPYIGMELGGMVLSVIVDDQTKVLNGEVLAQPGDGMILLPH